MTATHTTTNASRMPMLVGSAAARIGRNPAINPTRRRRSRSPGSVPGVPGAASRTTAAADRPGASRTRPGSRPAECEHHREDADDGADRDDTGQAAQTDRREPRREAALRVDLGQLALVLAGGLLDRLVPERTAAASEPTAVTSAPIRATT